MVVTDQAHKAARSRTFVSWYTQGRVSTMTYLLLLLSVVLSDEVKGHSVQGAGHYPKQGTEDQGGVDIGKQAYKACPQAKKQIPHEIKTL